LPAVAGSNAGAAVATVAGASLPASPPPQATAVATTRREQTVDKFRCCIEILLSTLFDSVCGLSASRWSFARPGKYEERQKLRKSSL
jgi:hypothetical protein